MKYLKKNLKKTEIFHEIFQMQKNKFFFTSLLMTNIYYILCYIRALLSQLVAKPHEIVQHGVQNAENKQKVVVYVAVWIRIGVTATNIKNALRETQTLRAGCSKAEPKIRPAADPFPGAQDGQNLNSWRWSLPSPTDQVW